MNLDSHVKIIGNYVSCVEFEVESVESHFAEVCKNRAETGSIGKCAGSDEIVCNFVEVIDIQCDSVVKHREIESDVKLCCLFPISELDSALLKLLQPVVRHSL